MLWLQTGGGQPAPALHVDTHRLQQPGQPGGFAAQAQDIGVVADFPIAGGYPDLETLIATIDAITNLAALGQAR